MTTLLDLPGDIIIRHIVPHLTARDILRLLLVCHYLEDVLQSLELRLSVNSFTDEVSICTSRPIVPECISLMKKLPNLLLDVDRPFGKALKVLRPLIVFGRRFSFANIPNEVATVCRILKFLPSDCIALRMSLVNSWSHFVEDGCTLSFLEQQLQHVDLSELQPMYNVIVDPRLFTRSLMPQAGAPQLPLIIPNRLWGVVPAAAYAAHPANVVDAPSSLPCR